MKRKTKQSQKEKLPQVYLRTKRRQTMGWNDNKKLVPSLVYIEIFIVFSGDLGFIFGHIKPW